MDDKYKKIENKFIDGELISMKCGGKTYVPIEDIISFLEQLEWANQDGCKCVKEFKKKHGVK